MLNNNINGLFCVIGVFSVMRNADRTASIGEQQPAVFVMFCQVQITCQQCLHRVNTGAALCCNAWHYFIIQT